MDGGRRTDSFLCLLSGHTADMANTSPGVILGCLFLTKKEKKKKCISYLVSVLAMSRISCFFPTLKVYVDRIHRVVKVSSWAFPEEFCRGNAIGSSLIALAGSAAGGGRGHSALCASVAMALQSGPILCNSATNCLRRLRGLYRASP